MGGFALSGLLGSERASMLPLWTLSLGFWVIAVDPGFIAGHQSIKNYRIWIDQLDHLPAVMTTSFFLIFLSTLGTNRANLPHLQFLANNCVYSSHTDIKLCTYSVSVCMLELETVCWSGSKGPAENIFYFGCECFWLVPYFLLNISFFFLFNRNNASSQVRITLFVSFLLIKC